MTSLIEKKRSANDPIFRSARKLIFGRLIVIVGLFIFSWIWYEGLTLYPQTGVPAGPIWILIATLSATALYLLFLHLGWLLEWQIKLQLIVDALFITVLISVTGELTSPFITLYLVLIAVSSLYLKPAATLAMAVFSLFLLVSVGLLPAMTAEGIAAPEVRRAAQVISFHVVAFLFVGLLAARLSDRRFSGEELQAAARSLASLRALHERIVESIRSGLITTDLEGVIYSANAAAAEITGIPADDLKGMSLFTLFPDMTATVKHTIEGRPHADTMPRFETDLITPEGFAVHIGYSISYLYAEDNQASGLIVTFQDLTDIRSMEENIRRKDRLAAVGRIAAGLAHEIRNPLGAMRGAIQVLESATPPDSMQADLMGIILRESDRLNSIITSFLNYARPKAADFVETDVCGSIRETMTLMRHSPDIKAEHEIVEELPPGPVMILADVAQLKQIFWNLARNAINAMPDGGRLEVKLSNVPNKRIRITFSDTGVGMPPERVEQLFEPFSQSTTGGTGLGLSIVYQIVRDHNGTISVRSAEGEGTTITVDLPIDNSRRSGAIPQAGAGPSLGESRAGIRDLVGIKGGSDQVSS